MGSMLRIDCLQQWFNMSDPQADNLRYDSASRRRFARIDLRHDTVPDKTTIGKFRHLLEAHQLTAPMFDAVKALLKEHQRLLKAGTIVDATIIGAPSSTKHATKTRDQAMRQTKTGNPENHPSRSLGPRRTPSSRPACSRLAWPYGVAGTPEATSNFIGGLERRV